MGLDFIYMKFLTFKWNDIFQFFHLLPIIYNKIILEELDDIYENTSKFQITNGNFDKKVLRSFEHSHFFDDFFHESNQIVNSFITKHVNLH